jgi:spore coat protein CotH
MRATLLLCTLACTGGTRASLGDDDDTSPQSTDGLVGDTGIETLTGPAEAARESLFSDDELPVFELTMTNQAISDLIDEPYEYVRGSLTYQGITYDNVAIRTKGENSWKPIDEKASLKIDLNHYDDGPGDILGLKKITLQAMNEDYSMMHERVGYRMFREAGVPAARATHALVYLNGDYYGLFTHLESVDDVMIGRWFEDDSGSLFEQHDADYYTDYVQNNIHFQLEEGEDNREALQALADDLQGSGAAAVEAAGEHINWDNFITYWAVGAVVMNFDTYPYHSDDCHVYHDPTTDQLYYIPHGVDESFYYEDYYYHMEDSAGGLLAYRCREVSECRDQWAAKVYEVQALAEEIDLAGYARDVQEQIQDWAEADPNKNYTMAYVRYYQDEMIDFIENRPNMIQSRVGSNPAE